MSYIQIQWNRSRTGEKLGYAHLAESVWNQRKKRSVQQRVYVGKLENDGTDVVISKGFSSRAGFRIPLEELRERVAKGEDLEAWLRMPTETAEVPGEIDKPACVEVVGDGHVLLTIARETGLEDALFKAVGPKDGAALLGLAFHQVVEGRPLYLAGDWLTERELPPDMRNGMVSVSGVYDLIGRVGADHDARETFFRAWFHRHKSAHAVIFDTTSISSYAADLDLAEYGYNRDGEKLPQVNLCLVTDRSTRLPLWCRPVPGSIPDVSTLAITVDILQDLGLQHVTASLDRGFYSRANVRDMLQADLDFIVGVPFSVNLARNFVRKSRTALASPKRSFPFDGHIMRHVRAPWEVESGPGEPRELDAHLFFEPTRRAERVHRLETTVFALESKAAEETFERRAEAVQWLAENARTLAKCFAVENAGDTAFRIRRKPRAVALAAARMGYTLVLASRPGLTPEEVLKDYRTRDQAEKLFDSLKNEHDQRRLRTGIDENAEGRLFLAFLALVLRAELENRMRKADLLRKVTVAQFFAQMRKIKAVNTRSGKRFLLEMAKRRRQLLAAVKVPLPS